MAVRRLAEDQPPSFHFTPQNLEWAEAKIRDYPEGRQASAVIPILWKAQEQHNGWLPEPAIRLVADMLDMPYIRVFEIATFYTMFQLQPVGTVAHIGVCGTTPCMLRGAEDIVAICKSRIAPHPFELSADGRFSWEEVECAGACVNAPMVQIGAATYEDLTAETFNALLDTLASGGTPSPGPQSGRKGSEPITGATTLTTPTTHTEPQGDSVEGDATPDSGVSPESTAARGEDAGRPSGESRSEVEAARSNGQGAGGQSDVVETADESVSKDEADRAAPGGEGAEPPISAEAADVTPSLDTGSSDEDTPPPPDQMASERANAAGKRPRHAKREDIEADDLQKITGIGPVIEKTLHDLGVFTFAQMAEWTQENKDWVNAYLAFKGRIDRERWVEQAQDMLNSK